jgi:hypothetical protein
MPLLNFLLLLEYSFAKSISNFNKFKSRSCSKARLFWEGPGNRVQKGVIGFVDRFIREGICWLFKES